MASLAVSDADNHALKVFDKLLLLKKGGQTVYFGDLGPAASTVLKYFVNNGARPCDRLENP